MDTDPFREAAQRRSSSSWLRRTRHKPVSIISNPHTGAESFFQARGPRSTNRCCEGEHSQLSARCDIELCIAQSNIRRLDSLLNCC